MKPLIVALPGNQRLGSRLAELLQADLAATKIRRFPDGETYLRYDTAPAGRQVVLACTLDRPDDKLLPLLFAAAAARDLGAASVGLVAPYLAYMRQDRRFRPGEAVTSAHFAAVLSGSIDWLVSVDPHLHRRSSLGEIYPVPAEALHAASLIADWIRAEVARPLLVGPDAESEQWVAAVAAAAGAPHVVLEKIRRGDRDVEVSVPEINRWRDRTPILVDDIVSTARTMIETVGHLVEAGLPNPLCIGVHAVFAGDAYPRLRQAGASRIVTCDTISHESNGITVDPLLAEASARMLGIADEGGPT
jgi:ribose-phosphate pyrophosphokinase